MFLLLKSLTLEPSLAKQISCEIHTSQEVERGTSPSTNGKLTISKLKLSRLLLILDETIPFVMENDKAKKGASKSKEIGLLTEVHWDISTGHLFVIMIINNKQVISRYLKIKFNDLITSA